MIYGIGERWSLSVPEVRALPSSPPGTEDPSGSKDARAPAALDTTVISPQARVQAHQAEATSPTKASTEGCRTCQERTYVDGSDDPTVSFKTPTSLGDGEAGFAVRAHEGEHVRNEQIRAQQQGREVVAQSVVIHTGICPECGKTYVAGGETRTTTRAKAAVPTPGAVFNAVA